MKQTNVENLYSNNGIEDLLLKSSLDNVLNKETHEMSDETILNIQSALANIFTNMSHYTFYQGVSSLGFENGNETIQSISDRMVPYSCLVYGKASSVAGNIYPYPNGVLYVLKADGSYRTQFYYFTDLGLFTRTYTPNGNAIMDNWHCITTESIRYFSTIPTSTNLSLGNIAMVKNDNLININGTASVTATLTAGALNTIFTMPEGYRPPYNVTYYTKARKSGTLVNVRIVINSNGIVQAQPFTEDLVVGNDIGFSVTYSGIQ